MYVASRMLHAMAHSGQAPAVFQRTNRRGVPVAALCATGLLSAVAFFSTTVGEQKIYQILYNASGLSGFLIWFGIAICHEGWRYPETVRWAARQGAHIVFHPHLHEAEPGSYRPSTFADPANSFHEKAALCRAAENTCFFATVNCASENSGTTSGVVRPDGTLLSYQPYGKRGLLIADIDIAEATGLLAMRSKQSVL